MAKINKTTTELINFIKESPTAFHAVSSIKTILLNEGFKELREEDSWKLKNKGKYFVTRNDSGIIAFVPGNLKNPGLKITASHSDSPTFKLKEDPLLSVKGKYTKLNTEGYGGMLCAPWFDRPLSIAGRVIIKSGSGFESRLLDFEKDLCLIPNVAIHMEKKSNEGLSYNKQVDMLPLISTGELSKENFTKMIAQSVGVPAKNIYGTDLYLYNRTPASLWGAENEFISSPRLDDLQCAFASLKGFLAGENPDNIKVYACLDNEEVGSTTKQGAASTFIYDVLTRIFAALGKSTEDYLKAVAKGFMLSCDNAHAVHPNHPEKTDEKNCVYMNEGIVIKSHAGQKYTSDALSIAMFKDICEKQKVPYQFFANRSDSPGGSTLGNIATTQVSIKAVDIGLAQLAMHSPYETAGVLDTDYMIKAVTGFYS